MDLKNDQLMASSKLMAKALAEVLSLTEREMKVREEIERKEEEKERKGGKK